MQTVTKQEFEALLPADFEYTMETVYDNYSYDVCFNKTISIRLKTSISQDTGKSGSGELFHFQAWNNEQDRPIGASLAFQIAEVKEFMEKLNDFLRSKMPVQETIMPAEKEIDFWRYVRLVLDHNDWSDFACSLRDFLIEYGSLTDKQLVYVLGEGAPHGRKTFEQKFLFANPSFRQTVKVKPKPDKEVRFRPGDAINIRRVARTARPL